MLRQTDAASAARSPGTAAPPALPDLTGVDLHSLHTLRDPVLAEAVDRVLLRPAELAEMWSDGGDPTCTGG